MMAAPRERDVHVIPTPRGGGVAMYLGSTDGVDKEHLRRLKQLVKRTNTPWLSDHLCWGSVDGSYSHDAIVARINAATSSANWAESFTLPQTRRANAALCSSLSFAFGS